MSKKAAYILKGTSQGLRKAPGIIQQYRWLFTGIALIIVIPILTRLVVWMTLASNTTVIHADEKDLESSRHKIRLEMAALDRKLNAKWPRSYYLVINSSANEFQLYRGEELIRQDKCSTGSYILLKNGDEQQWMFKTPKGEFRIQHKTISPVWKKPDWAFIEEGLPVPSANHHTRFEHSVLGDYALSIGDGYLIHGTLYQRFLGLPVTHGCIRLNDENLEMVFNSLQVGSKVYIY